MHRLVLTGEPSAHTHRSTDTKPTAVVQGGRVTDLLSPLCRPVGVSLLSPVAKQLEKLL